MARSYSAEEVAQLLTELEASISASADVIKLDSLTGCVASASRRHAAGMVRQTLKDFLKEAE